ncbi:prolipoprotein diacylglyceryl transferase [Flavobacterium psychrotrophum]|uniref:prolipoprotein diacylglyceryl transferase n=1 Tax=Flavobacterium psychrotrophum TaxID=2294119 RepID=UPI000E314B2A|nr:prolipoprotein diacylglyceryl transferase [Flavobacterium psychrotrophum]
MIHSLSITWNPTEGFDLGPITIRIYSLMFVVAFGLGWFVTKKIFDREGESVEKLDKLFIYTIVATLLGARLGHVFFYDWPYFKDHLSEILLPFRWDSNGKFEFTGFAGLASHGAALGVILAVLWYSKKVIFRPALWVLDRITLPVTSGGIFVRIGNFFNSEIIGKPVTDPNMPTAVRFVRGEDSVTVAGRIIGLKPYQAVQLTQSTSPDHAYKTIEHDPKFAEVLNAIPYRYPAQLYEAFLYIFVFAILFYMYWKTPARKFRGLIFGVFLVLLWTVRFVVEYVKESQGGFEGAHPILSTGQWLSIPFILVGFYLIFTSKNRTETL